jgi:hypothetical protein
VPPWTPQPSTETTKLPGVKKGLCAAALVTTPVTGNRNNARQTNTRVVALEIMAHP